MKLTLRLAALLLATLVHADSTIGGIGAQIQIQQDGTFSIIEDLPHSPAEMAGLAVGDIIEAVQTSFDAPLTPVAGKTLADVVQMIRGEVGTTVVLEILRNQQEMNFSLVRAVLSNP
jgi:carboxyl-terminal processing protease